MNNKTRKAFALSIVLWIVAAIMLGVTVLLFFAKDSVRLSGALEEKLQTQMMVEEVFEALTFYAMTASHSYHTLHNLQMPSLSYDFPVDLVADNRWYDLGNGCSLRVMDTSGLVNVMMSSPETIAIAATSRSQRQLRYEMKDSLADWIDPDQLVRLSGAESSSYKIKWRRMYGTRDAKGIQDEDELRLIKGFDTIGDEQWRRVKEKLYVGHPGKINLALTDAELLGFLLDISQSYTQTLVAMRAENMASFSSTVSRLKGYNEDAFGFSMSRQLRIEIIAQKGKARSVLNALTLFQPDNSRAYTSYFMRID